MKAFQKSQITPSPKKDNDGQNDDKSALLTIVSFIGLVLFTTVALATMLILNN